MVHSAIKRRRSEASNVPWGAPEFTAHAPFASGASPQRPNENITSSIIFGNDLSFSPEMDTPSHDPKSLLQSLLYFLTDTELSGFIQSRLSRAALMKAPLYLTIGCIEGLHDFFRPSAPAADFAQAQLRSPKTSESDIPNPNPFCQVPVTRNDSSKVPGGLDRPSAKQNCTRLLVSLATFLSLVEPAELRSIIMRRLASSQSPYTDVSCFVEFMASGGDGIPQGKAYADARVKTKRMRAHALKKEKKEQQREKSQFEDGTSHLRIKDVGASGIQQPETSSQHLLSPINREGPSTNVVLPSDDVELEEGEISPHLEVVPPALKFARPSLARSVGRSGVPSTSKGVDTATLPPPKKKKKNRGKAKRKAAESVPE